MIVLTNTYSSYSWGMHQNIDGLNPRRFQWQFVMTDHVIFGIPHLDSYAAKISGPAPKEITTYLQRCSTTPKTKPWEICWVCNGKVVLPLIFTLPFLYLTPRAGSFRSITGDQPLWAVSGTSLGPPNPSLRCYNLWDLHLLAGTLSNHKSQRRLINPVSLEEIDLCKIKKKNITKKTPASWIWTHPWFSSKAHWISSSSSSTCCSGSSTKSICAKTGQWSEAISSDEAKWPKSMKSWGYPNRWLV